MARAVTEIDELIEQGLSRYGEGELDEALLLWERALAIDPENAQANSYVDYVRMNYELLTSDSNNEQSGPFGIGDDEPEYQIEIQPDEDSVMPAAPLYMESGDEGWMFDDESSIAPPRIADAMLFELEADEPPVGGDPATFESTHAAENVSFEDATREYPGGAGRPANALLDEGQGEDAPAEFASESMPEFGSLEDLQSPQSFAQEPTELRRRDLGFVQPAKAELRVAPATPELKMPLRTPGGQASSEPAGEPDRYRAPTADAVPEDDEDAADAAGGADDDELAFELETPPAGSRRPLVYASLDLDLALDDDADAALDLVARADTRPAGLGATNDAASDAARLITSLPTPQPPSSPGKPMPGNPRLSAVDAASPNESAPRELPLPADLPPALGTAPTQDMPHAMLDPLLEAHRDPQQLSALIRDFADKPTTRVSTRRKPPQPDALISAPTRELGLRPDRRAVTEDETTGHFEFHKHRVSSVGTAKLDVPGMDPIDMRSAEILEEIDGEAPANETREDRTRRRILALLQCATEWGQSADHDRAVAAADLALSEDPNSALAQKLIHRNREAIMNVFQGFLGDLQRTPALARPLHELGSAPISPRAAFLLSRVDGTLSLDEILDVSGMPRLEAYRYLCQLLLRGILR